MTNAVKTAAEIARKAMINAGVNCSEISPSVNRHNESSAYFSASIVIGKRFSKSNVRVSDHDTNRSFSMADAFFFHEDHDIAERATSLAHRMIAAINPA